ncbi:MAG: hypothetical protein ACLFR2_02535 [Candidatus Kapaibacterium sp.]
MKKILFLLAFMLLAGKISFAQEMPPESKPDAELTEEEAELRIEHWQSMVDDLKSQLESLNQKFQDLQSELDQTNTNLNDCNDEIKSLLGVSDADIAAFRQSLGYIEGKVRELQRISNDELIERQDEVKDLERQLNELRMNKIALLPEFYNKIIKLAKDIKGLYREKKIDTYTVKPWSTNRDCLWNIAGRIEIYGDPFLWPKIWQANTDLIRNPDIIYPGWVLQIPGKAPKTSEELKAERKYYREKRERMESEDATAGQSTE